MGNIISSYYYYLYIPKVRIFATVRATAEMRGTQTSKLKFNEAKNLTEVGRVLS